MAQGKVTIYGGTAMPAVANRDVFGIYFIRTATGFKICTVANTPGKEVVEYEPETDPIWTSVQQATNLGAAGNVSIQTFTSYGDYYKPVGFSCRLSSSSVGLPADIGSGGAYYFVLSHRDSSNGYACLLISYSAKVAYFGTNTANFSQLIWTRLTNEGMLHTDDPVTAWPMAGLSTTAITDFNDISTSFLYADTYAASFNNPPPTHGMLLTGYLLNTQTRGAQLLIGGNGRVYVRGKAPTGWGAWNTIPLLTDFPAVNDGVLTLQVNGTTIGTFSANQSDPVTFNIPTVGYTLPVATGSVLGGVKVGANLFVNPTGVLSGAPFSNETFNGNGILSLPNNLSCQHTVRINATGNISLNLPPSAQDGDVIILKSLAVVNYIVAINAPSGQTTELVSMDLSKVNRVSLQFCKSAGRWDLLLLQ